MTRRHLIIRLEAPLLSFGGVVIDNYGFTRDFPARSMLAGLFSNAFGWSRTEQDKHQKLQDRLIFAARIERENHIAPLQDVQNAELAKNDKGWTTRGETEGRAGASYGGPHRRFRDYHPDALVIIALRLEPVDEKPDLGDLASALERPVRPLFFGRKPCLPSSPLVDRTNEPFIMAETAGEALRLTPRRESGARQLRAIWPRGEAPLGDHQSDKSSDICDERNWRSGLHGGTRAVIEGHILPQEGVRS